MFMKKFSNKYIWVGLGCLLPWTPALQCGNLPHSLHYIDREEQAASALLQYTLDPLYHFPKCPMILCFFSWRSPYDQVVFPIRVECTNIYMTCFATIKFIAAHNM